MKVAVLYSGYLRFIQETFPKIKEALIADEPIEFYFFAHTWDSSKPEDIEYLLKVVKPLRYLIEPQKDFEVHPYQLMNVDDTHEEYLNNPIRLEWNKKHPTDIKHYFEKPSVENNFNFSKDVEIVKYNYYSHYPYNSMSLFYSLHQSNALAKSWKQENNIEFDFVVRMRSDMIFTSPIHLSHLNKDQITLFEAAPHSGNLGIYTVHDQFAIGNPKNMNIYHDIFIYLPAYYSIMKLDLITEICLGYHLMRYNIPLNKIARNYQLLRYSDRNSSIISRPKE
jgi:hypothetical protein